MRSKGIVCAMRIDEISIVDASALCFLFDHKKPFLTFHVPILINIHNANDSLKVR